MFPPLRTSSVYRIPVDNDNVNSFPQRRVGRVVNGIRQPLHNAYGASSISDESSLPSKVSQFAAASFAFLYVWDKIDKIESRVERSVTNYPECLSRFATRWQSLIAILTPHGQSQRLFVPENPWHRIACETNHTRERHEAGLALERGNPFACTNDGRFELGSFREFRVQRTYIGILGFLGSSRDERREDR